MNTATVNIRSAARRLGVHENTIRNWMRHGLLKFHSLPTGIRRIPLSEVQRLEKETFRVRSEFPPDRVIPPPPAAKDHSSLSHR